MPLGSYRYGPVICPIARKCELPHETTTRSPSRIKLRKGQSWEMSLLLPFFSGSTLRH